MIRWWRVDWAEAEEVVEADHTPAAARLARGRWESAATIRAEHPRSGRSPSSTPPGGESVRFQRRFPSCLQVHSSLASGVWTLIWMADVCRPAEEDEVFRGRPWNRDRESRVRGRRSE